MPGQYQKWNNFTMVLTVQVEHVADRKKTESNYMEEEN